MDLGREGSWQEVTGGWIQKELMVSRRLPVVFPTCPWSLSMASRDVRQRAEALTLGPASAYGECASHGPKWTQWEVRERTRGWGSSGRGGRGVL